ncbi:hypothetical protein [Salinicoccus sp. CNSTN-B1]
MWSIERFGVKNKMQIIPSVNHKKVTLEHKGTNFTVEKYNPNSHKLTVTTYDNQVIENGVVYKTQKAVIEEIENYLKNM